MSTEVSTSTTWGTPPKLLKKLKKRFKLSDFDPAPYPKPPDFDGLEVDWNERTFCNPPYDDLESFLEKGYRESCKGNLIVMLVPARTHTRYFHKYVLPYASIEFIEGRIRFADLKNGGKIDKPCGFGCCLVIFDVLK